MAQVCPWSSSRSTRLRTKTGKKRSITWLEAARSSGAVYADGSAMTKKDALTSHRPVVGYLTRGMIKDWYDPRTGGSASRVGARRVAAFGPAPNGLRDRAGGWLDMVTREAAGEALKRRSIGCVASLDDAAVSPIESSRGALGDQI